MLLTDVNFMIVVEGFISFLFLLWLSKKDWIYLTAWILRFCVCRTSQMPYHRTRNTIRSDGCHSSMTALEILQAWLGFQ